jgi:predicted RNase H-like HicB family nuclease
MKTYTSVVERCRHTGLYVGYVPGFPGAHSQGKSLDELRRNLAEVLGMLLEDGAPALEAEFIDTQTIQVG